MAAAALYSFTMSSPVALGAVPEDSPAKKHHVKNGKGFTNPWESWRDFNPVSLMGTMIGQVILPSIGSLYMRPVCYSWK